MPSAVKPARADRLRARDVLLRRRRLETSLKNTRKTSPYQTRFPQIRRALHYKDAACAEEVKPNTPQELFPVHPVSAYFAPLISRTCFQRKFTHSNANRCPKVELLHILNQPT